MRVLFAAALAAVVLPAQALAAPPPTRWCGTPTADDRPDAVAGFQTRIVYAFAADAPDRFAERVLGLARDLAVVDEWWRGQDASRTPRFDLFSDPACDTEFGRLDVASVRLPNGTAHYFPEIPRYERVVADLAPSIADSDKKYLVFYDGPVDDRSYCGRSVTRVLDGGPDAVAAIWLGSFCGDGIGSGTNTATAAAHELLHNLGALPLGAPNACPGDAGHPCDDVDDILAAVGKPNQSIVEMQLDAGRNDYYAHGGDWLDIQDSPFLERLLGPDVAPPSAPGGVLATSTARGVVRVRWGASSDDVGPIAYRVYRNGTLVFSAAQTSFADRGSSGETIEYAVRAFDAAGRLGERSTVRFRVGLGIVDAAGALIRDTVAPPAVPRLRMARTATHVVLRWGAVRDGGGLRGYRVTRNGRAVATVRGTTLRVRRQASRGVWRVRAIDRAGNIGPVAAPLRVK